MSCIVYRRLTIDWTRIESQSNSTGQKPKQVSIHVTAV